MNKINLNNQSVNNKLTLDAQPGEIKNGDTYLCSVKEKISGDEAIVKIKGKDFAVKFEGAIPRDDRFMVEVVNVQGDKLRVKAIPPNQVKTQPDINALKSTRDLGGGSFFSSAALKEATAILTEYNISLDPTVLNCVKSFLKQGTGGIEDKLDSIKALAAKGLEITTPNLRAVHEALHGQPLSDALNDLAKDLSIELKDIRSRTELGAGKPSVEAGLAALRLNQEIEKAIKQLVELVVNNPRVMEQTEKPIKQLVEQVSSSPQVREQMEKAIRQLIEQVLNNPRISEQTEKSIKLLIEQATNTPRLGEQTETAIKQLVEPISNNFRASQQTAPATNERIEQSTNTLRLGEPAEKASKQLVEQATEENYAHHLNRSGKIDADSGIPANLNRETKIDNDHPDLTGLMSASQIGKDYLITQITPKLSQVAQIFTDLRREVVRNLENITQVIQEARTNIYPQVKSLLESTIDILDRAILKSDITLYTDLQTEKHLMVASSRLAEAKKLLAEGSTTQAAAILEEVKQKLEALNWRPVIAKAIHTLPKDSLNLNKLNASTEEVLKLRAATAKILEAGPGARNLFETLRALGLNHDSEVGQALASRQSGQDQQELRENLKAVLVKLLADQSESSLHQGTQQKMAQILDNLSGQQLLSKFESNTELQSMFFNLPVNVGGELQSVKVYINSRKERQKIDWANCSIYFLINTKKLGETGIQLTAADRNLTLTLKNDRADFAALTEKLVAKYTSKLQEVGYNVVGVSFARLNELTKEPSFSTGVSPSINKPSINGLNPRKGFDFKA